MNITEFAIQLHAELGDGYRVACCVPFIGHTLKVQQEFFVKHGDRFLWVRRGASSPYLLAKQVIEQMSRKGVHLPVTADGMRYAEYGLVDKDRLAAVLQAKDDGLRAAESVLQLVRCTCRCGFTCRRCKALQTARHGLETNQ